MDLAVLIRDGRHAELLAALENRFESHGDVGSLFLRALQSVLLAGDLEAVERLAAALHPDFALKGLVSYGLCCVAAKRSDLAGLSRHARDALRYAAQARGLLARDREFLSSVLPILAQQAFLYEPPGWDPPDRIPEPDFTFPGGEGLPVLVAGNGTYFERFFPAFRDSFRAVARGCRLHAHIVNPTEACRRLRAETPDATFTAETADWGRAYYASSRFLILGRALERAPAVVVSDIDVLWHRSPADLLAASGDFGYFAKPGPAPNLLYHAQLLLFRNTPPAVRLVAHAANYIRAKIKEFDAWTVDQVALLRAVLELGDGLDARDFNTDFGAIEAFHELQPAGLEEKRRLRQVEGGTLSFDIGPDGKPRLSRPSP